MINIYLFFTDFFGQSYFSILFGKRTQICRSKKYGNRSLFLAKYRIKAQKKKYRNEAKKYPKKSRTPNIFERVVYYMREWHNDVEKGEEEFFITYYTQ